ncbi:DNA N-6-adenine-methyltransferase family protein, partial [Acinetobacter baumannii 42057_6]
MNTMAQSKLFGLAENRTDVWSTPQDFFEKLDRVFNFDLDVCALPENAKCERYFTPEIDGLKQEWTGTCWMNPPYGKEIIDWVAKAA